MYLELHTCYRYENSDRRNPAEGTVRVKVFTVRNLSDISGVGVFGWYFGMTFHACPIKMHVREFPPLLAPPKLVRYNESYYQIVYGNVWETEKVKLI
jgi:hypothetical protein